MPFPFRRAREGSFAVTDRIPPDVDRFLLSMRLRLRKHLAMSSIRLLSIFLVEITPTR